MIEKLKELTRIDWDETPGALIQRHAILTKAYEKINELVDAGNPTQMPATYGGAEMVEKVIQTTCCPLAGMNDYGSAK